MTELVFILDRSGSMAGLEKDTVGGFNSMIEKQRREAGEALVSTVLFHHETTVVHDRLPLHTIRPMTEADYLPCGCTALLDAVGTALNYEVISEAVCRVRAARPLGTDWKRRIDADVERRGR